MFLARPAVIELGTRVSPDEIAQAIGEVLGREVKAQALPREAWAGALEHRGLPKGSTWAYEEMTETPFRYHSSARRAQ